MAVGGFGALQPGQQGADRDHDRGYTDEDDQGQEWGYRQCQGGDDDVGDDGADSGPDHGQDHGDLGDVGGADVDGFTGGDASGKCGADAGGVPGDGGDGAA